MSGSRQRHYLMDIRKVYWADVWLWALCLGRLLRSFCGRLRLSVLLVES